MGYSVYYNGSVRFSQPIPAAELHDGGDLDEPLIYDDDYIHVVVEDAADDSAPAAISFEPHYDEVHGINWGHWETMTQPILDVCERLGVTVSGEVSWGGEDAEDNGIIYFSEASYRVEQNIDLTVTEIARRFGVDRQVVIDKLGAA